MFTSNGHAPNGHTPNGHTPDGHTPNSIKVALAIGHWQLDIGHLGIRNTTQCFA